VTPYSTLAFTGPTSVPTATAGSGNQIQTMFFFAPATTLQSYAYPLVYPYNQGCPARSEWIFPMTVSQGFIIPPDQFQQAYLQSNNSTNWWSMFYFCTSSPLRSEFVVEATVTLTQPYQVAFVGVESGPVQISLPPSTGLLGFSYIKVDAEGTDNTKPVQFLVDYETPTMSQGITFATTFVNELGSGNVFTFAAPNSTFEGAFSSALFNNSQTTSSFFAYYSTPAPSSLPASFNITLFPKAFVPPVHKLTSFPSVATILLDRYNFSVTFELDANGTSIPSNATICMPDWSVLDTTSTSVSVTLSNGNIFTLPSTQNPYNPYCMEIYIEYLFSMDLSLGVTTSLVYLPIELQKPIPLTFEFNYNWQTTLN